VENTTPEAHEVQLPQTNQSIKSIKSNQLKYHAKKTHYKYKNEREKRHELTWNIQRQKPTKFNYHKHTTTMHKYNTEQ
jgi:hypothetical protein